MGMQTPHQTERPSKLCASLDVSRGLRVDGNRLRNFPSIGSIFIAAAVARAGSTVSAQKGTTLISTEKMGVEAPLSKVRSARFRPIYRQFFWLLTADCVLLGYAGRLPPEGAWLVLSRFGAANYFLHLLVVLPIVDLFERPLPLPVSISQPVRSLASPPH